MTRNVSAVSALNASKSVSAILVALPLALPLPPPAFAANAINAAISAGRGGVITTGNVTTINQASQNLAINWSQLSTTAGEALVFNQPNASAIALNRITGPSPSALLGSLSANGQVFILNPNGVLFGSGAQVNVGGLVASTLGMSDADFMAGQSSGKYSFTQASANIANPATLVNQGSLAATPGGYIALLSPSVSNQGSISATLGTALLAAGNKMTLRFNHASLVSYSVDQGALQALAENKQLIQADGGQVILSAQAANALSSAVVNNSGLIEAKTLQNVNGTIKLLGDLKVGNVNLDGTLDASAPTTGNGGFIETSAAHVKVAAGATVSTAAPNGKSGTWLIDPTDYTIAATGGDIAGATLSTNLGNGNVTIQSTSGASGTAGNVNVNDTVNWSANTLTLNAQNNININQTLNGSGTAGLALQYGQSSAAGTGSSVNIGAPVNLASTGRFSTKQGSTGVTTNYTIITSLGSAGSTTGTDLQGMSGNLAGNYVLGGNIDASATSGWNSGAGLTPVAFTGTFTGNFNGLDHTISNLVINQPNASLVGLFGTLNAGAAVSNVGLVGGSITGSVMVGGLVGYNNGTITNSYATGSVTGSDMVGGLVGYNYNSGTITNSYATGSVTGTNPAGGLVGYNGGTITNSYATGSVTLGSVSNNGDGYSLGGLAGNNSGTVTNSFWNVTTTGQSTSAGGTGLTTAQIEQLATFTGAGWSIAATGGTTSIWRIYEGNTAPLLRSFLTPLALGNATVTYSGAAPNGSATTPNLLSPATRAINVGNYSNYYYSNQQGYDIVGGGLTIAKAPLTVTANNVTQFANMAPYSGGAGVGYSGFVNGETSAVLGGSLSYSGSAQGAINQGTYAITPGGLSSGNYSLTYINGVLTLNPSNIVQSSLGGSQWVTPYLSAQSDIHQFQHTDGQDNFSGGNNANNNGATRKRTSTISVSTDSNSFQGLGGFDGNPITILGDGVLMPKL